MNRTRSTINRTRSIKNTKHKIVNSYNILAGYTPVGRIIVSLTLGILLSPFSNGVTLFISYIIIYEVIYYLYTSGRSLPWDPITRVGIFYGSIAGWLIGRQLFRGGKLE